MTLRHILAFAALFLLALCPLDAQQQIDHDDYNCQRGIEEMENQNYDEAQEYFLKALNKDEHDGYAYAYMGRLAYYRLQQAIALRSMQLALRYVPERDADFRAQIYAWRGDMQFAIRDTTAALRELDRAIALAPRNSDYRSTRSMLYLHLNNYPRAVKEAEEALRLDTASTIARYALDFVAVKETRWADVQRYSTEIIQRDTTAYAAYENRLNARYHLGDMEGAANDLASLWRVHGNSPIAQNWTDSLAQRDYAATDKALAAAMKRWPDDSDLPYARYHAAFATLRMETALKYAREAARLRDDVGQTAYILAPALEMTQQFEEALDVVHKGYEADSTSARLCEEMAYLLNQLGRSDEALRYADRMIELRPDVAGYYNRRALVSLQLGRLTAALRDARYATTLDTTSASYQMNMAYVLMALGRQAEARPALERAVRLDSVAAEDGQNRGLALFYLGRKDEARQWATEVLRAWEGQVKAGEKVQVDPTTYYWIARLYSLLGETDHALALLRKGLDNGLRLTPYRLSEEELANLRPLPAYKALIKEYEGRKHAWK